MPAMYRARKVPAAADAVWADAQKTDGQKQIKRMGRIYFLLIRFICFIRFLVQHNSCHIAEFISNECFYIR